jgi:transcription elongation factor Elf1
MPQAEQTPGPTYLTDFIDDVLIECPRCGAAAAVRAKAGLRDEAPAVRCGRCGFNRTGWPMPSGVLVNAIARRRCPRCGRWLEKRYQRVLAKRREVVLSCPCGAQSAVALNFTSIRLGEPYDPYFGYPLWLRKTIGANVLWAYNHRHLAFLRTFVGAPIRPRTPHANSSLVSRLPRWMTAATMRTSVLKGIAALEHKAG